MIKNDKKHTIVFFVPVLLRATTSSASFSFPGARSTTGTGTTATAMLGLQFIEVGTLEEGVVEGREGDEREATEDKDAPEEKEVKALGGELVPGNKKR